MGTRALILVRVSGTLDGGGSSPDIQRRDCEAFCTGMGWTVVGITEDLDVSGSTDPLERTGSGPWLRDRPSEFDVVVSWKLSRVGRNARHISALMNYLMDHGKNLRCVHDAVDLESPISRMIVYILATIAEMDLKNITDANVASTDAARREGRYKGGAWPAGYRAVKRGSGGYELIPDEDCLAPEIRRVVRRVIDGDRMSVIVEDLNSRGVPTARDRQAALSSKATQGFKWTLTPINNLLRSETLLGLAVERTNRGTTVRYGSDGRPGRRADPLISEEDFRALQHALDARKMDGGPRSKTNALLLQVIHCAVCDRAMHRLPQPDGVRYKCPSYSREAGASCGNGSVMADEMDGIVTRTLLMFGSLQVMDRVYRPGSNNGAELADVSAQIERVTELVLSLSPSAPSTAVLSTRLNELEQRRSELEADPGQEAGYDVVPTGETFAEKWARLSDAEKNDLLREFSIRLTVLKTGRRGTSRVSGHLHLGQTSRFLGSVDPSFGQDAFAAFGQAWANLNPGAVEFGTGEPPAYDGEGFRLTLS